MALSEFVAANFWYLFGIVFLIGTALLMKTRVERTFIIFLIRTKHGIRWLDKIGNISPGFWKFTADLAIIVAFGGFGALYVFKYRKVYPFLLIVGVVALLFSLPLLGNVLTGGLFLLLLIILFLLQRVNPSVQRIGYFVLASLLMLLAALPLAQLIQPGLFSYIIAAVTGVFGLPGLLISVLAAHAGAIVLQQTSLPGVSPLLPGVTPSGEIGFMFPGFDLFIPLSSGLIALIILLVFHEFSHGILARVQGIKIKNMGLLTFGILPIGAFVEPDEKSMESKRSEEKMRVMAMGSFANLVVAGVAVIVIALISLQIGGMVESEGVEIISVQEGFPAEVIEPGTVIKKINGVDVATVPEYISESAKAKPGETITLETDKGTFTLQSVPNPQDTSRAYLGFTLQTKTSLKEEFKDQEPLFSGLLSLASVLYIIWLLNFNVALINLLPVVPFDGSKMFDELLKSFQIRKKKRKKIIRWVVIIVLLLLLVNALPLGTIFLNALMG